MENLLSGGGGVGGGGGGEGGTCKQHKKNVSQKAYKTNIC